MVWLTTKCPVNNLLMPWMLKLVTNMATSTAIIIIKIKSGAAGYADVCLIAALAAWQCSALAFNTAWTTKRFTILAAALKGSCSVSLLISVSAAAFIRNWDMMLDINMVFKKAVVIVWPPASVLLVLSAKKLGNSKTKDLFYLI